MEVIPQRMTAIIDKPTVVFLIGMRINHFWKIRQWWPVAMAMPSMLKELGADKSLGCLSSEMWFGRTTIMVQYWESFDALEHYAKSRDQEHLPAWAEFNKRIGKSADVGIWHETYEIAPGSYECIYHNMPPFGLGKVGKLVEAINAHAGARGRLKRA